MILQDYIAGASASLILLTGYITGFIVIGKGAKQKASLMVWSGVFLVLMGQFYLGTVVNFVKLIITGTNLQIQYLSGRLAYTGAPISIIVGMFVGFSMIKPKWKHGIVVIYSITAIGYWIGLYLFPQLTLTEFVPDRGYAFFTDGLMDISLESWVLILTAFYLVSLLAFNTSGLLIFARKSSGVIRKKLILQSIGYLIFVVIGAVDSLFELAEWIFLPRIVMAAGYIILAVGYTMTK